MKFSEVIDGQQFQHCGRTYLKVPLLHVGSTGRGRDNPLVNACYQGLYLGKYRKTTYCFFDGEIEVEQTETVKAE